MSEISCEEVLSEIELYIDGEVDEARSVDLAGHLTGCTSCLDRADFRRRLKEIVAVKCRGDHTPEDLLLRIRASIRTESRHA